MQHVLCFLIVAKKRSFTLAARACSVVQPSLSNGIRKLEAHFGAPLFRRGKGRTREVLTELGRVLRPHLVWIAQPIVKAERQAADYRLAGSNRPR